MKRTELKKLIKPLVKECVQETILNDGLLSNIVSEVMQGMGNQFLIENKEQIVPTMSNENSVQMEQLKERQSETRKRLLDEKAKMLTTELIFLKVQRLLEIMGAQM